MVCFLGEPQLICILIMLPTTFHPPRVPLHPGCTKCGHRPAVTSLPGVRDHDPRPQPPHTESESTALKSLRHFCHHQHVKSGKPPRPSYLRTGVRSGGKGPEQDVGSQDKQGSLSVRTSTTACRGSSRSEGPADQSGRLGEGAPSRLPSATRWVSSSVFSLKWQFVEEPPVCLGATAALLQSWHAQLRGVFQTPRQRDRQTANKTPPNCAKGKELGARNNDGERGTPALLSQREPLA